MERLTENDRGTFVVTTKSGTKHTWVITDDSVTVLRVPAGDSHWSMRDFRNGVPNIVSKVHMWPEVDGFFLYFLHGDTPWTRSSRIRSIERVDDESD